MTKRLVKGEFNLEDFQKQLQQLKKMGPLTQLLEMVPGMGKLTKDLQPDVTDKQMKLIEAMINSMTIEERRDPRLLNGSRKRRVAKGAGVTVPEVNDLLSQFRDMQRLMKQMSSGGRGLGGALGNLFR
jgi:signal recognition particle subunit SRP54